MRKQVAAARGLVSEGWSETPCVERDQKQIGLPGEVLCRRLARLRGGREMDVAVARSTRRAIEAAKPLRVAPQRSGTIL